MTYRTKERYLSLFSQHVQADVQKVQEAIYSAVDVMQAMESSMYTSLSKVFNLN